MNSLTSSCWSSWCCKIWIRALTLEPEYWLVLAGLMRLKLDSSSSDIMGGPEKKKRKKGSTWVAYMVQHTSNFHSDRPAQEQTNRHLLGVRLFPGWWCQIHHHLPLHCSSCLTGFSVCLCRTGPKVWSQFVSWGSQGAGVRPDQFYSSVDEIMQGWASFPCDFST